MPPGRPPKTGRDMSGRKSGEKRENSVLNCGITTTKKNSDASKEMAEKMSEMQEVLKRLEELKVEIREMMKMETEKNNEEFNKRWKVQEEDRKKEREEWRKEREEWRKKIEELEERDRGNNIKIVELNGRLGWMEEIEERKEKEKRKMNVVIRGCKESGKGAKEEAEKLLKEKLELENVIESAMYMGGDKEGKGSKRLIIARMRCWEGKMELMKRKKGLSRGIYIEDDMTKKERWVQSRAREVARGEKEKGNITKVGYKKVKINDVWYIWEDGRGDFIKSQRSKNRGRE